MSQLFRSGTLNRRALVGLGAASGLSLAGLLPRPAHAAGEAAVGTFPEGASGDSVFVGITLPLTGSYSADGDDGRLGYELAIAQINAGDAIAKQWGMAGKGVLGKTVRFQVVDEQTNPNVAVQEQTQFIERNKAIMITGSVSSATAIAIQQLAQRDKVLNMVGSSGSNDTTGKDCRRYGFRSQPSAYMACTALGPVVAKAYGEGRKAAYLVPDYTYGHSVYDSFEASVRKHGWTVATQQVVPLGTGDYSAALLNIANSGADIFVNVAFAGDAVASCKQAQQFGVLDKMKLIVPNLSAFQAKELGAEIMQGVFGTLDFFWALEDRYPLAKSFVTAFLAKNSYRPAWDAHIAYMQTYLWALSVERAKTFNPVAVIKTLEASKGQPYQSTLGPVWYRAEDHQLVRPVPVVRGKTPAAMSNKEDFYDVIEVVDGASVISPPDMFGCHLGAYQ